MRNLWCRAIFACRDVRNSCKRYQVKLVIVSLLLANIPLPVVAAQQAEKMWSLLTLSGLDEYRLWQQIIWKRRLPSVSLISRTRFEERKSLFFSDWSYRLRQRVLLNRPLTNNLSLVISNEIFLNINKASWIITDRLDQNRAYLGVEQHMSENTYLGVGYMNQYLSTPILQSNHVLWINWRIDLEKSS